MTTHPSSVAPRRRATGPRRFHFQPVLTVAALLVLGVLLGLGTWQASRYQEATALLADYRRQHDEKPPITTLTEGASDADRGESLRFRRVSLKGRLVVPELQLLTARYKFQLPGYGLLVPLQLAEGGPHPKILVYLGWVPRDELEGFLKTLDPAREVVIEGRLNKGDLPGPNPAPVGDHLGYPTWRNTNLGVIGARVQGLDPDLLIQSGKEAVGEEISLEKLPLDGYKVPVRLAPAKHVEYSMTWYGIALSLVVVYFAYAFRRTRRPEDDLPEPT